MTAVDSAYAKYLFNNNTLFDDNNTKISLFLLNIRFFRIIRPNRAIIFSKRKGSNKKSKGSNLLWQKTAMLTVPAAKMERNAKIRKISRKNRPEILKVRLPGPFFIFYESALL